jgi:hypothetical protein
VVIIQSNNGASIELQQYASTADFLVVVDAARGEHWGAGGALRELQWCLLSSLSGFTNQRLVLSRCVITICLEHTFSIYKPLQNKRDRPSTDCNDFNYLGHSLLQQEGRIFLALSTKQVWFRWENSMPVSFIDLLKAEELTNCRQER